MTMNIGIWDTIFTPVADVCSKENKLYLKVCLELYTGKRVPQESDLAHLPPHFHVPEKTNILVPIVKGNLTARDHFNIAMMAWAPLVSVDDKADYTSAYITSLAVLLVNIVNNGSDGQGKLRTAFTGSLYDVHFAEVDMVDMTAMLVDAALSDEIQKWIKIFENEEGPVLYGMVNIIVGFMLVLMAKPVSELVSDQYFFNRYTEFSRQCSGRAGTLLKTASKVPSRKRCGDYYSVISGIFNLRRMAFKYFRSSATEASHPMHATLEVVLKSLEFNEMNHIYLIMRHLLQNHSDIVSIPMLYMEGEMFNKALEYMLTKPEEDRPFIKILYPQIETHLLSSKHFHFLTAAARIVASYNGQRYKRNGDVIDDIQEKIKGVIKTYLDAKVARS